MSDLISDIIEVEISNASYGKKQEFLAVAELIRRGFDVYLTLVDNKGIDCIIRVNENRYLDIQIKARSKNISPKNFGFFPLLQVPKGRNNHFFIFYSEDANQYWVVPSEEIIRLANVSGSSVNIGKSGGGEGLYAVKVTGVNNKRAIPKPQFSQYEGENGFKLLK